MHQPAPLRGDDARRVETLQETGILDSAPEESFDRIVHLATRLFEVPIALVSLVDSERQWFKARCGLEVGETSRDVSFCSHAVFSRRTLVVPDASLDARFAYNPLVLGEPFVRFYAGAPIRGDGGHVLGTMCLIDTVPRRFSEREVTLLNSLADVAAENIRLRTVNISLGRALDQFENPRAA